jgi:hydrocephalus-inducing protein
VWVSLAGLGKELDVSLTASELEIEPAYISLCSQGTLRIKNRSEQPLPYSWAAFANASEEDAERRKLLSELNDMHRVEEQELDKRCESLMTGQDLVCDESVPSDASSDSSQTIQLPTLRAAQAALRRKYRHLRQALEDDRMSFADGVFDIQPPSGEVWANSDAEMTVLFRPCTASDYGCWAFLDVVGRQTRLPLWISSSGIGPKVELSCESMNLGDIFINSTHVCELTLVNKGDIPAVWSITPDSGGRSTSKADSFTFSPSSGELAVQECVTLQVTVCSDRLGEFTESFAVSLEGNRDPLSVQYRGHVVGPTFNFSLAREGIDFGIISFLCPARRDGVLENTSEIPMAWRMRVPLDGAFNLREILITPESGLLAPGESVAVQVEILPQSIKVYEYFLSVDVEGVGEELCSMPLRAESRAPPLTASLSELRYGTCYLRYPECTSLTLSNPSDTLTAIFKVLPQEPFTCSIARIQAEPEDGRIPPGGSIEVPVWLTCEKAGPVRLPLAIEVAGSSDPHIQFALAALAVGPVLVPSMDIVSWGPTQCLIDSVRPLVLKNTSKIPAHFRTFVKSGKGTFRVDVRDSVIGPGEELELNITAHLNDTGTHDDELHVVVTEGESVQVKFSARGMGSTMHCGEDLSSLDFGPVFTCSPCERRVTVENKGRRPQSLKWINETLHARKLAASAAPTKGKGPKRPQPNAAELEPVFHVYPEEIELRPRTAITFKFKGESSTEGDVAETLVCRSTIGKEKRTVFTTEVTAAFTSPVLSFSRQSFDFMYTWEKGTATEVQQSPLVLTNTSPLPVDMVLRTSAPFSVDSWEHVLEPGESTEVQVLFDPGYRADRQSHVAQGRLTVVYTGHPRRDAIPLTGDIAFPNVDLEYTSIGFGYVMNDTTCTKVARIANCGRVDAAFSWSFLVNEPEGDAPLGSSHRPPIPINQAFDILPIRSLLRPGESEEVEFVFYGHANRRIAGQCVCELEGGPDYILNLSGEAANVGFRLDRSLIDFGRIAFPSQEDREFSIVNTGKVPFPFAVHPADEEEGTASLRPQISVSPPAGIVPAAAGGKSGEVRVTVRVKPLLPERIRATIIVEAGHFDPVHLHIYAQASFAAVAVSLPREVEDDGGVAWKALQSDARNSLMNVQPELLPPAPDEIPPPPGATTSSRKESPSDSSRSLAKVASSRSVSTSANGASKVPVSGDMSLRRNSAGPAPTHIDVEMEANRLRYIESIRQGKDFVGLPSTFFVARYVIDLGHVVLGFKRRKSFRVTNASALGAVSWSFDKALLAGSGFVLDPQKVQRLPEGANANFTASFQARVYARMCACSLPMGLWYTDSFVFTG